MTFVPNWGLHVFKCPLHSHLQKGLDPKFIHNSEARVAFVDQLGVFIGESLLRENTGGISNITGKAWRRQLLRSRLSEGLRSLEVGASLVTPKLILKSDTYVTLVDQIWVFLSSYEYQ